MKEKKFASVTVRSHRPAYFDLLYCKLVRSSRFILQLHCKIKEQPDIRISIMDVSILHFELLRKKDSLFHSEPRIFTYWWCNIAFLKNYRKIRHNITLITFSYSLIISLFPVKTWPVKASLWFACLYIFVGKYNYVVISNKLCWNCI